MIPVKVDLECYRGQTWRRVLYFTDSNGQPIDMTGTTVTGQIRPKPNDERLIKTINATVASGGKVTIGMSAASTEVLEPGVYCYDIKGTKESTVDYYIYGLFEVKGRVTT